MRLNAAVRESFRKCVEIVLVKNPSIKSQAKETCQQSKKKRK